MARARLTLNPENASIKELKEAARVGSSETATRCMAIQMLLAGAERQLVCDALVVTDRAVRNWMRLFNHSGVDGIIVNKRPGRTAIIRGKQAAELSCLIENPEKADRTFWTAKAFHGYISDAYQVECSYETVVRFFHREGFAVKAPQPWPDRQDESLREKFIQTLERLHHDEAIDLWFADESGFEGDPRPRRRWDKNGDHLRMNVIGMVCPRTGEFFAIEASHSDTDTFQAFLDEASKAIHFQRTHNILVLDNASWHKQKKPTGTLGSRYICPPIRLISILSNASGCS